LLYLISEFKVREILINSLGNGAGDLVHDGPWPCRVGGMTCRRKRQATALALSRGQSLVEGNFSFETRDAVTN
jgi:hypothetical protein